MDGLHHVWTGPSETEMIDQLARALCKRRLGDVWSALDEPARIEFRGDAMTALETLRPFLAGKLGPSLAALPTRAVPRNNVRLDVPGMMARAYALTGV